MITQLAFVAVVIVGLGCFEAFGLAGGIIGSLVLFGTIGGLGKLAQWYIGDPMDAYDREHRR